MIQITCLHCKQNFHSLILDREKALAEISTNFMQHIANVHTDQAKKMAIDCRLLNMIAIWTIMVSKHTTFLDENNEGTVLAEHFDKVIGQIEECLGVDISNENDAANPTPTKTYNPIEDLPPLSSPSE